jgi:hypothetical protein
MNIRIKELAEQAWDSLIDEMGDVYREDGINWDFLHAYDKRYAELIVRECANRIDYWESRQGEHSDDLLKHFGVEE